MTKEDAIKWLERERPKNPYKMVGVAKKAVYLMAIDALKKESSKDAVDRNLIGELVDANGNVHYEDILRLPSVQSERKKGKWIEQKAYRGGRCRIICCSECKDRRIVGVNIPYEEWAKSKRYCESCGAEMEAENE